MRWHGHDHDVGVGDRVVDTGVAGTMIDLIRDWDALKPALEAKAAAGGGVPLASVKLEAPVQRPGRRCQRLLSRPSMGWKFVL